MPLSSIVVIVLRLFSLSWLVQGVTGFAAMAATMVPYTSADANYLVYAAPTFFIVLAVFAWLLSPVIARLVTPQPDSPVSIGGLTRYDLYCFAFVFLGLYFILSSVANSINWLHYALFLGRVTQESDPRRQTSFYQLTQPLITLIAGVVCVAFASRFARKLTDMQRKSEAA